MSDKLKIIRLPQVQEMVGLKTTAIYDKVKNADFPKPIRIGCRCTGWLESEVQEWIKKQVERCRSPENDPQHQQAA